MESGVHCKMCRRVDCGGATVMEVTGARVRKKRRAGPSFLLRNEEVWEDNNCPPTIPVRLSQS